MDKHKQIFFQMFVISIFYHFSYSKLDIPLSKLLIIF